MERCDALVVGGGPAGSSCARTLTASGMRVVVLDRATFPRPKVCAGWVSPQVFATLEIDPVAYRAGRVLQPFRGFRTELLGGPVVETRYGRTVSHGILRAEFDHFLLARSGAEVRQGEPLTCLERRDGAWIANRTVHAPVVIGAGGHFCPVARHLGAARRGGVVAAVEVEFPLDVKTRGGCRVAGDTPELLFYPDLRGYAWCVRKGDHLNVGLGREDPADLPNRWTALVAHLVREGRLSADPPARRRGHAYRLWGRGPGRLVADGALLVGDAAGLAYPRSGEGIRPAVESGILAARTILEAREDYREAALASYPARLARRLGRAPRDPSPLSRGVRRWAAAQLLAHPRLTRSVVLDRWFLRATEPALHPA